MNNLRKIVTLMVAHIRRERADVRQQEFFGAREGAEADRLQNADEKHLGGQYDEALALLATDRDARDDT